MAVENAVGDSVDPISAVADFAIGHVGEIGPKWSPDPAKHLFRRIERNAPVALRRWTAPAPIADLRKPRFLRRGFLFDGRFIRPRQRRPPEQEDRADRDAKGRTLVRP